MPINKEFYMTNNYKMSFYEAPISNNIPVSELSLNEVVEKIKFDDEIKSNTLLIQSLVDDKTRNQLKCKLLPSITVSGTFSNRKYDGLIEHSGLLCLDIDKIIDPIELNNIKIKLLEDNLIDTVLLFVSPSGSGLKWFVKIPPKHNTHLMYFLAVENYLSVTYNIKVDSSGKDVTRKCLIAHDPKAFSRDLSMAKELDQRFIDNWLPTKEDVKREEFEDLNLDEKIYRLTELVNQINEKQISIADTYDNWHLIGFALAELGEKGREFFHKISKFSPKYDLDENDEKFTSLLNDYNGSITLGTLYYIAKQFGVLHKMSNSKVESSNFDNKVKYSKKLRTMPERLDDAKKLPKLSLLLGNIWCKGEVHVLFGDNGTGKSIWATQIADALSKGTNTFPNLPNQVGPQKVLFYDFELSDTQIIDRYSDEEGNIYPFNSNLIHDQWDFSDPYFTQSKERIDKRIFDKMKNDIDEYKPDVIIIDNITFLRSEANQDANVALSLTNSLIEIKKKHGISMIVLAHTPKVKPGLPITNNDLAGSKNISNFADSISAIGVSSTNNQIKYIKSIKCRSTPKEFEANNVIMVKQEKLGSFLQFTYLGQGNEYELIKDPVKLRDDEEKEGLKQEVINLHSQGKSYRQIEDLTGLGKSSIGRIIQDYRIDDNILL